MLRASLLGVPLLLVLSASACTYDNGDADRILTPTQCSTNDPAQSTIDVDRQIEVDAGQGAGVFIDYASGGHWQLRTTCDTAKTDQSCQFDILITPQDNSSITNVIPTDLESNDSVLPFETASYQFLATTSSDVDGVTFDSDPGAPVAIDVFLDGTCALPYVFWVGDGALHPGEPTNPLILQPSGP